MKKIILVLMFSLGLINAANIDALCGENEDLKNTIRFSFGSDVKNILNKLILNHYSKEFKIDNKESICAYMNVYDLSFLNTQLTQDDIEQFERYMAEDGKYEHYEEYKKFYTRILKFFKYYRNHISSYKTKDVYNIGAVGDMINDLQKYNGAIRSFSYVYGNKQGGLLWGDSFDDFKEKVAKKTACSEATVNSKEELVKCAKNKKILPPILKWAESNMKQKDGKNDN